MRLITLKSFAKFNPVLEVLGRDPMTGRHFISTILVNLDHFDLVTVERTGDPSALSNAGFGAESGLPDEPEIISGSDTTGHLVDPEDKELTCLESAAASIPLDITNTVAKACKELGSAIGMHLPVSIRLLKRIPVEAGLGGGSGNAAAVLIALVKLFDLDISAEEVAHISANVGTDVPFFLAGGIMIGEHFGEMLTDLGDHPEFHVLVLKPVQGSHTSEAYSAIADLLQLSDGMCRTARTTRSFRTALKGRRDTFQHMRNDFDLYMLRSEVTGSLFAYLQKMHAERVIVAGSGSAVAGIFKEKPAGDLTTEAFSELGDILECAFIARTAPQGIEVVDWE